ncbi:hybrid sensor histidine kinase/response regulator [Dyella kyungheensis]|uniref:histidine kinase n=1 Tax=Dyella kyungheensis TaxID=1242174 RepID=A0ABS2JTT5_9GAMM|nr:PAS domain-containing sensor histidine kinase [Dyella kyungheensis]MBM7122388.1 PAS domain S-box protein [Dyella kyungheensis]
MNTTGINRYELLVDSVVDYAICLINLDGTIASWNVGCERSTGYVAAEVLGKHIRMFYADDALAADEPTAALVTAHDEGRVETEGWRVRKDGSQYWANVVLDLVKTPDGTAIGYASITRDLTERKQAEDRLRRSEEQFRLLLQGVGDCAIYMLDPDGCITSWNTGAQRIKGYTREEILGKHLSTFYTLEDRAAGEPQRALGLAASTGRFEAEGWRVRKDGSSFWAHVIIDRINGDDGRHVGFAKVTRDITARRDADAALADAREALFQSQKLEAVGQLTGGVAHDFNNLLMAVIGSLELLEVRLSHDPHALNLLGNALAGARRGAALTKRMLAFARKQELQPTSIDLKALVQGISSLLQRSAGPTITIDTVFPLALHHILVDGNQLELALLNLVMNARDAMPSGGHIIITAKNETIEQSGHRSALPPGGYVSLSVTDDGHGMDAATLERATEPFFTTKGIGKGTGLGLSMVHGLAEQSGGRLLLRSEAGRGTTAELWLPMAMTAEDALTHEPEAPVPENSASGAQSILVVDDDPLIAMTMSAVLNDLGHITVEANSAREALDQLSQKNYFDLMITDYAMPVMNGLQLIEQVQARWPHLPIILATGYAELPEGSAKSVLRLPKPFGRVDLVRVVDAAAAASASRKTSV